MAVDLLWFTGSYCPPCKNMLRAGVKEEVEKAGFTVQLVDIQENRNLAHQHGVSAVPWFVIRKDSEPVRVLVGAKDARTLLAELRLAEANG